MLTKFFALLIVAGGFALQSSAQVFNVPEKAKEHFKSKYKDAADIDWKNNVSDYNCYFKQNGIDCRANYHLDGSWNYTEKKIEGKSIPGKVNDSFSKSTYRDWEVQSVQFVENNDKENLYRYEVKEGVKKAYVFFDKNGLLIREKPTI